MQDWAFWNVIRNGSDHKVIACYLELYEEGEVEYINGPSHPYPCHMTHYQKAKGGIVWQFL